MRTAARGLSSEAYALKRDQERKGREGRKDKTLRSSWVRGRS